MVRISPECKVGIENSAPSVTVLYHEALHRTFMFDSFDVCLPFDSNDLF